MNDGAKQARAAVKAFHYCLNSSGLLPSQTYIPANVGFAPVCVVNQIVALFFSHNYERIPGLIRFAYERFDAFDVKPVFSAYKAIAFDYLCQVSFFLREFTDLDKAELERTIPSAIFHAGPKAAPDYDIKSGEFPAA
ncbi:hypothetical protein V8J88_21315 [Massilia sp. W12]|uniref:hypothetical protein n=1 Tax=Massilia sp. W12 TaxID=3126507 RepID=UPI0030CC346A